MKNQLQFVSIDEVQPGINTRQSSEKQDEKRFLDLQRSMESAGFLQNNPLLVMPKSDYLNIFPEVEILESVKYVIIDGEGRYRAAIEANIPVVPIVETDQVIENLLDLANLQYLCNISTSVTEADKFSFYVRYTQTVEKAKQSATHFCGLYPQFNAAFYTQCQAVSTLPKNVLKYISEGYITIFFAYETYYAEKFVNYNDGKKVYCTNPDNSSGLKYKELANKVLKYFYTSFDPITKDGRLTAAPFYERFSFEVKTLADTTIFVEAAKLEKKKGNKGTVEKESELAAKEIASAKIDDLNKRADELLDIVKSYNIDANGNKILSFWDVPQLVELRTELKATLPADEVPQLVFTRYKQLLAPTEQEKEQEKLAREAKKIADAEAKERKEAEAQKEAVKTAAIGLKNAVHTLHGYLSFFEKDASGKDKAAYLRQILTAPAGIGSLKINDALDILKEMAELAQNLLNTAAISTSTKKADDEQDDKETF